MIGECHVMMEVERPMAATANQRVDAQDSQEVTSGQLPRVGAAPPTRAP
jgi:hypothetical protein